MLTRQQVHENIYFISLLGVAIGLPLNKIVLSLSGILMAANWLIEGNFRDKIIEIKRQKSGLLFTLLFLILAISLIYTENLNYGQNDLRIKLPMLLFPIVILSSKTLDFNKYYYIILGFLLSVVLVTVINYINFITGIYSGTDCREMSLFGSHIRLSLMVTFCFFVALYGAWINFRGLRYALISIAFWLLFYTYKSEVLTGYFSMIFTFLMLLFWSVYNQVGQHRKFILILSLALSFFTVYLFYLAIYPIPKESMTKKSFTETTIHGGKYQHDTTSIILENGYYIHYFVCHAELDSMWHLKTGESIEEFSKEQPDLFPTLIRYMSSLGLRKDAEGFTKLSDKDIKNIIHGIPSVVYAEGGIKSRLARINIEFQKYLENADPNGSTIQQRLEYWRTGRNIIESNPIFGVGVGDVQDAFFYQFKMNRSRLFPENQLHSHQQFMTIWISSGIFALLIFILHILLMFYVAFRKKSILLFLFNTILTFSYFFEDTLETQVGVTLAAFFITFLFKQEQEQPHFDSSKNKQSR